MPTRRRSRRRANWPTTSPPAASRASEFTHRHRAREIRLPPRRPDAARLTSRTASARCWRRMASRWLGADPRSRQPDRAEARRAPRCRWSRPGSWNCRAACCATLHETRAEFARAFRAMCARSAGAARPRLRAARLPSDGAARGHAVDAEGPLRHHAALHAAGRHARPRHDDAHLHGAGQPRLRRPRPTWSRSCACRWRCSRWRPRCSPTRPSPRASRTASCRYARPGLDRHRQPAHRHPRRVFEPGFGFERYVEWLLDVPMYFVDARRRVSSTAAGRVFRDFMAGRLATCCRASAPRSAISPTT